MSFFNKLKQTGKAKKYALIISAVLIVVTMTVGGTMAWLSQSQTKTNSFSVSDVKCSVIMDESGNTRKNIKIKNTGSIDEYVRATVVLSWVDSQGDTIAKEVKASDYTMEMNSNDWFKGSDGYYYHKAKVAQNGTTENLINSFTANTFDNEYTLKIDVLSSAIQAEPKTAVESLWAVIAVDTSGNLINK